MAFIKKIKESKGILFLVLFGISLVSSTNIDCIGKSFHCINSTHFMICVDLGGGVSTTVDDFVIPCPPKTECKITNHFECEFQVTTTPAPIIRTSDVTNELEISATTFPWEEIAVPSVSTPTHIWDSELSDLKSLNNESSTTPIDTTAGIINANEITTSTETVIFSNTSTTTTIPLYITAKVTEILPKSNPRPNTENILTTTTESHIIEAKVTQLLPHNKSNFPSSKNDVAETKASKNASLPAVEPIKANVTEVLPEDKYNYTVRNAKTTHESITDKTIIFNTSDSILETTTELIYTETNITTEVLQQNTLNNTDPNDATVNINNELDNNITESTVITTTESIYTEFIATTEQESNRNITNNEPKLDAINYTSAPLMETISTDVNLNELSPKIIFGQTNEQNLKDSITNTKTYINTTINILPPTTESIHTEAVANETFPENKHSFTHIKETATSVQNEQTTTENTVTTESGNINGNMTEVLSENKLNFTDTESANASAVSNKLLTKSSTVMMPTTDSILVETNTTEILLEKVTESTNNLAIENKYSLTTEHNQSIANATKVLSEANLSDSNTVYIIAANNEPETNTTTISTTEPIYSKVIVSKMVSENELNMLKFSNTNASTGSSANDIGTTNTEKSVTPTINFINTEANATTEVSENKFDAIGSTAIDSKTGNKTLTDAFENFYTPTTETLQTDVMVTEVLSKNKINSTDFKSAYTVTVKSYEPEIKSTDNYYTMMPITELINNEIIVTEVPTKFNSTGLSTTKSLINNERHTYASQNIFSLSTETIQTQTDKTKSLPENKNSFPETTDETASIPNNKRETLSTASSLTPTTKLNYTETVVTETISENYLYLPNFSNTEVTTNKHGTDILALNTAPTMNSDHTETSTNASEILPENSPNLMGTRMLKNSSEIIIGFATEKIHTDAKDTKVLSESKLNFTNNGPDIITNDNILTSTIKSTFKTAEETKILIENKTSFREIKTNKTDKNIITNNQTVTSTTTVAPMSITDSITHENYAFTESLYFTEQSTNAPLIENNENNTTENSKATINKVEIYGISSVPTTENIITASIINIKTGAVTESDPSKSTAQGSGLLSTSIDTNMFSNTTFTVPPSINNLPNTINAMQNGVSKTILPFGDSLTTTMDTTVTINQNKTPVTQTSQSNWSSHTLTTETTTQKDQDLPEIWQPVTEIQKPSDSLQSVNNSTSDYSNNVLVHNKNLTSMNSFYSTTAVTTKSTLLNMSSNETEQTVSISPRPTEYEINSRNSPTATYEWTLITPEIVSNNRNTGENKGTRNEFSTSTTIFPNQIIDTTESEAPSKSWPILENETLSSHATNTGNELQYLTADTSPSYGIYATNQSFNKGNISGNWQNLTRTNDANNINTMSVSVTENVLTGHTSKVHEKIKTQLTNEILSQSNVNHNATITEMNGTNTTSSSNEYVSKHLLNSTINETKISGHEVNDISNKTRQMTQTHDFSAPVTANLINNKVEQNLDNSILTEATPVVEPVETSHSLTMNKENTTVTTTNIENIYLTGAEINLGESAKSETIMLSSGTESISNNPSVLVHTPNTVLLHTSYDKTVQVTTSPTFPSYGTNTGNDLEYSTTSTFYGNHATNQSFDKENKQENWKNPLINVLFNMSKLNTATATPITEHVNNSYITEPFTPNETMITDLSSSNKDIKYTSTLDAIKDNGQISTVPNYKTSYVSAPAIYANRPTQNGDTITNAIQIAENLTVNSACNRNTIEDFATLTTPLHVSSSAPSILLNSAGKSKSTSNSNILLANNSKDKKSTVVDLKPTENKSLPDSKTSSMSFTVKNTTKLNRDLINNLLPVVATLTTTMPYTNNVTLENLPNEPAEIGQTILNPYITIIEDSLIKGTQSTTQFEVSPKITHHADNNMKINSSNLRNSTNSLKVGTNNVIGSENLVNSSTTQVDIFPTLIQSIDNVTINPVQNVNDTKKFDTSSITTGKTSSKNRLFISPQLTTKRSEVLLTTAMLQNNDDLTKTHANQVISSISNIIPEYEHASVTKSIYDEVKSGISTDDMHHLVEINRGGLYITSSGLEMPYSVQDIGVVQGKTDPKIEPTDVYLEKKFHAITTTSTNNIIDSQDTAVDLTSMNTPYSPKINGLTNEIKTSTLPSKHEVNGEHSNSITNIKDHTLNVGNVLNFGTSKSIVYGVTALPKTEDNIEGQVNSPTKLIVTTPPTFTKKFIVEPTSINTFYNKNVGSFIDNTETNTETLQNRFKVKSDVTKPSDGQLNKETKQIITTKNEYTINNFATTQKITTNVPEQTASKQTMASTPVIGSPSLKHTSMADKNVHANERETVSSSSTVSTSDFYCQNRVRGRYGDNHDCRKFYICIGRPQPIVGLCPVNTVFSEIKTQCTKNLSHCIRENQFQCPAEGRFADYFTGNIYYICVKDRTHFIRFKFQCQRGYHLDKKTVKCLQNNKPSTQSLSLKVKPVNKKEFICKQEGKFPDPDLDKNIYYMCIKKSQTRSTFVRFTFQCQKGYHLNKTTVRCLQDIVEPMSLSVSSKDSVSKDESVSHKREVEFKCKEPGKFPHPNNCRKYYICSVNKKSELHRKKKKCDSDEVFNKDKKKCVNTDSYEC